MCIFSQNEFSSIQIPLVNDFGFRQVEEHELDKCHFNSPQSKIKSSILSMDHSSRGWWVKCSIF